MQIMYQIDVGLIADIFSAEMEFLYNLIRTHPQVTRCPSSPLVVVSVAPLASR